MSDRNISDRIDEALVSFTERKFRDLLTDARNELERRAGLLEQMQAFISDDEDTFLGNLEAEERAFYYAHFAIKPKRELVQIDFDENDDEVLHDDDDELDAYGFGIIG